MSPSRNPKCAPILAALSIVLLAIAPLDAQPPGRGRGRGGFGPRGFGNDLVSLIAMREVRDELSINDDQAELLDALADDLRDQRRAAFSGGLGGPPGRGGGRGEFERLNEAGEKLIWAVMEPEQADRLSELRVQFEGLRAFERDDFAAALKLTDLQRDQVREIRAARRETAEVVEEVRMSLTEKQIEQWEEMKGESFTFPERRGRFGRRGFDRRPRDDSDD